MVWVCIEDADTHDVSDFAKTDDGYVLYLMDEYRVDKHNTDSFVLHDMEDGRHIVYKGLIYKGGFGYNLWIADKFVKL